MILIKINQKLTKVPDINLGNLPYEAADILELMAKNNKVYEYETLEELKFELIIRIQITRAAILLYKSDVQFATFRTSKCNEQYWKLTEKGAFELKPNVLPQTGIEDIFLNSNKYAFECATAIVIIFYKAVLESIDHNSFNRLFSDLILYDWEYDQDLNLETIDGTDYLPGDCVYFKNPDHDPETPHWRGENAIILEEGLYYGHGIGIKTKEGIIKALNTKRKKNPEQSAYLTDIITRVKFNIYKAYRIKNFRENPLMNYNLFSNLIVSEIGSRTYFF